MDTELFHKLDATKKNLSIIKDYRGYIGRAGLKFRYLHSADYNQRLDPAASNIMDCYLLTRTYDIATEMVADSTTELFS